LRSLDHLSVAQVNSDVVLGVRTPEEHVATLDLRDRDFATLVVLVAGVVTDIQAHCGEGVKGQAGAVETDFLVVAVLVCHAPVSDSERRAIGISATPGVLHAELAHRAVDHALNLFLSGAAGVDGGIRGRQVFVIRCRDGRHLAGAFLLKACLRVNQNALGLSLLSRVVALMIRRLCFYGRLGLLLSWLLRGFCGGRRLVLRWCLAGGRSGLRALCIACVSDELIVVLAGGVAARFTSGTQRGGAVLSIGGGSGARPEGVLASSNQAVDSLLAVIVTRGGLLEACGGFWRSSCRGVRGGRLGRCLGVSR